MKVYRHLAETIDEVEYWSFMLPLLSMITSVLL
jgi:hypothetical protein